MNRAINGFFPVVMLAMALAIATMKCNITITTGTPALIAQDLIEDNSLKSLTLSGNGSWDRQFNPNVLNYTYTITYTVESITLTPNANSKRSKITINNRECRNNEESVPISLRVGKNEIAVQVTEENGDVQKYTIMVERLAQGVKSDDNFLQSLTLSGNGSWDRQFNPNVLNYTYTVTNTVESITLTPNANSKMSKITINNSEGSSNEESLPISLRVGRNEIAIRVTAENGDVQKYTIMVERLAQGAKSDDNFLQSLTLSGNGSWDRQFNPNVLNYTCTVPETVESITLTPNANSKKARITVNNRECRSKEESLPISLRVGGNEIAIRVTAENGDIQKYVVIVNRLPKKNSITGAKTSLVCVGNSNTRRSPDGGESYVTLLAEMLGSEYDVKNFGIDGATMVRGMYHYMEFAADSFKQLFIIKPDIITVMLGTNDSKSNIWKKYGKFFEVDAQAMIDTLLTISPKPRLILVLPPKSFKNKFSISDSIIFNEQVPILRDIAERTGIEMIDVNTPTDKSDYFTDGVHFSIKGTELLAEIYHKGITK
ncbi:MAG: cadherin-like beta sandwich domain-containing protein [Chitinispirillia bacterium]